MRRVIARCPDAGVNPGYALGRDYDELPTACSSRSPSSARAEDIDRLAEVLGEAARRRTRRAPSREEVRA